MDSDLINQRRDKFLKFIKKKSEWVNYILLATIVYIAVWIRTRNLAGLRDITTGQWTLGPDLDPFLFLRWAKYIVENGSLFTIDSMRYVPLGFDTGLEFPLLSHLIAWFHKVASIFGSTSVEQSAVYFPVFMFAITVIAFFLMTRAIFSAIETKQNSNYIALVASLFLSIIPVLLPRTIAGIPEKESAAFFFFFMTFYFLILGWRQNNLKRQVIFSVIGGIFAGLMALTWGGYGYILIIVSLMTLILFMFNQVKINRILSYYVFIAPIFILSLIFFPRFSIRGTVTSIDWMFALLTSFILLVDYLLHNKLHKFVPNKLKNYPKLTSFIYSGVLLTILGIIVFGFDFVVQSLMRFYSIFRPNPTRLIQTVAENREPFFVEWAPNFGPYLGTLPIIIGLIFISSILLFYKTFKESFQNKRNLWIMTGVWAFFFLSIMLTRYNSTSTFNGSNFISILVYIAGLISLAAGFVYFYVKKQLNLENIISVGFLFVLVFLAVGLQSAKSSIRLVLMLVPVASILIGYIFVLSAKKIYISIKEKNVFNFRNFLYAILIISVLFSAYNHFYGSKNLAQSYVPSAYNQQWQKAMSWVRESTPTNAVFAHWWDYGYWIQSIGQRATVLDGGNLIGYWNHFMGRYALTETNFSKTLEFFYAHNVTNFLIDSTDIGKYSAYSIIGSDANYDRRSWIPTMVRDDSKTTERKNATLYVYPGGALVDQDIRYSSNGTEIFLPEGKAYAAAVVLSVNGNDTISDVFGVYYLQDKSYQIPLRYYWDRRTGLVDTGKGLDAGAFIYSKMTLNSQGGGNIEPRGALLYMSPKTVTTNLARFYLYGQENPNFRLVHSEEDSLVAILKSQGAIAEDFVYYNEFRGPIKIWEVKYPSDIKLNPIYLETEYPEDLLLA